MRRKLIIPDRNSDKTKNIFLFNPRYCAKCAEMFWWESVPHKHEGGEWTAKCPNCKGFLWRDKQSALNEAFWFREEEKAEEQRRQANQLPNGQVAPGSGLNNSLSTPSSAVHITGFTGLHF